MIDYGFFEHDYPYTNFHELNLNWILRQMIELRSDMRNFVNQNTIKYADPIQWNITTQYEGNTVVIEPISGNAYISSQPVPAGVAITNEDYWSVIGNFSLLYESIKESIAAADDGSNINATEARVKDSLLWLNSKLYKVLSDISVGALYITSGTGQNLQEVTIEELLNNINNSMGSLDDLITDAKNNLVSAINEVKTDITDVLSNYPIIKPEDFGASGDGSTDDTSAFIDCFAAGENKIILLTNTYKISDTVSVPSNCQIIGIGGKILDEYLSTSGDLVTRYMGILDISNKENINITGVIFEGSSGLQVINELYYKTDISIKNSKNITIKNCSFAGCNAFTQISVYKSNNIVISENYFNYYRYQGIVCGYSKNIAVNGNIFEDCGLNYENTYAIGFTYEQFGESSSQHRCQHVECNNNIIDYPNNTANWESIDAHGIGDAIFNGNIIRNGKDAIAVFSEGQRGFTCTRVTISDNIIERCAKSALIVSGYDFNITNNTIVSCGSDGTGHVIFIAGQMEEFNISSNIISNCYYSIFYLLKDSITNRRFQYNSINNNIIFASIPNNGEVDLIHCSDLNEQFFIYPNYFDSNKIIQPSEITLNVKMPITVLNSRSILVMKDNSYGGLIPTYNSFVSVAPDIISQADRNNVSAGIAGHEITIADFTNSAGSPYKMVYNGTAYAKLLLS